MSKTDIKGKKNVFKRLIRIFVYIILLTSLYFLAIKDLFLYFLEYILPILGVSMLVGILFTETGKLLWDEVKELFK